MLLVIELFKRDFANLWIGVKIHLLAVLDAFAFPPAVIGFELCDLRIAGLENLLDHLLEWPALCRSGVRRLPMAPDAPARKIL